MPSGCELAFAGWGVSGVTLSEDELIDALEGCSVLICELEQVSARVMDACPLLRVIIDCRGTPVNVDVAAATQRRILVVNTPARNADSTADLTLGLILCAARQISKAEAWLRDGRWTADQLHLPYKAFRGMTLSGSTIGIVGSGAVGSRVALRCQAFGMKVQLYDPYMEPEQLAAWGSPCKSLDLLLASSDVLSIHVPLNPQTTGLIGARELSLMKPTALLVNAARAAVVDKQALYDVLRTGRIRGAALDVYWQEPPSGDDPFFALGNVTMTPHVGGASDGVIANQAVMALDALSSILEGRQPDHMVNQGVPIPDLLEFSFQ